MLFKTALKNNKKMKAFKSMKILTLNIKCKKNKLRLKIIKLLDTTSLRSEVNKSR